MDESHRLTQMPDGYDSALFSELYKKTAGLRKKLASQIDPGRFGVSYDEILSWFDVKFIFAFNKYYHSNREYLLGFIINSLKTYKLRLVKNCYTKKLAVNQTTDIEETSDYEYILGYEPPPDTGEIDHDLKDIKNYLKGILSPDAYFLLDIELNPPPYILVRLPDLKKKHRLNLPPALLVEYLGIGGMPGAEERIRVLKSEISTGIKKARRAFLFKLQQ